MSQPQSAFTAHTVTITTNNALPLRPLRIRAAATLKPACPLVDNMISVSPYESYESYLFPTPDTRPGTYHDDETTMTDRLSPTCQPTKASLKPTPIQPTPTNPTARALYPIHP